MIYDQLMLWLDHQIRGYGKFVTGREVFSVRKSRSSGSSGMASTGFESSGPDAAKASLSSLSASRSWLFFFHLFVPSRIYCVVPFEGMLYLLCR